MQPRARAASNLDAASASADTISSSVATPQAAASDASNDQTELTFRPQVDANRLRRKLVAPSSHESPSFMHDPVAM